MTAAVNKSLEFSEILGAQLERRFGAVARPARRPAVEMETGVWFCPSCCVQTVAVGAPGDNNNRGSVFVLTVP